MDGYCCMFMNWATNPGGRGSGRKVPKHGGFIPRTYCLERIVYYGCILFAVYTLYQRLHSTCGHFAFTISVKARRTFVPCFSGRPKTYKHRWQPQDKFHLSILVQISTMTSL